jgi:hypothetical protein
MQCDRLTFVLAYNLTYITTNHGELAQGVTMDISNEYGHGEGEVHFLKPQDKDTTLDLLSLDL